MIKAFLVNTKTKKEYEVVGIDKEKNEVLLKGPHSTFTHPFDKEAIQRLGYTLVRREVED
jgi:hypothetical protein